MLLSSLPGIRKVNNNRSLLTNNLYALCVVEHAVLLDEELSVAQHFHGLHFVSSVDDGGGVRSGEEHLDEACVTVIAIGLDAYEVSMITCQRDLNLFAGFRSLGDGGVHYAVDGYLNRACACATAYENYVLGCRQSEVDAILTLGNTVVGSLFYVFGELNTLAGIPSVNGVDVSGRKNDFGRIEGNGIG